MPDHLGTKDEALFESRMFMESVFELDISICYIFPWLTAKENNLTLIVSFTVPYILGQ